MYHYFKTYYTNVFRRYNLPNVKNKITHTAGKQRFRRPLRVLRDGLYGMGIAKHFVCLIFANICIGFTERFKWGDII